MEENAMYLLYDMCRLCLDVPGTHNIFENDELIQDIFLCTGILQISCTDNLPRTICTTCMYKIEVAKDIREYATKNDLYMRSLLNNDTMNKKIAHPRIAVRPTKETVSSSTGDHNKSPKTKNNNQDSNDKSDTQKMSLLCPKIAVMSVEKMKSPKTKRPRISVRSMEDINSETSVSAVTSSKNDHITPKMEKKSKFKNVSNVDKNIGENKNEDLKCGICKKVYPTSKKFYLHQRSHSKSLYCPLDACGKRFATKGDLQKHIRSHTGERPYKCDLCDKSFTQNVTLKSHKAAIHENADF